MAGFVAIPDPRQFAGSWNRLDWSMAPAANPAKLSPGRFVNARPDLYAAAGKPVHINENGPSAQLRYCDSDQFPVNFPQGTGMIAARDPTTSTGPYNTPVFLRFEAPVLALGAYVTVKGANVAEGSALHAVLWVFTTASQTWSSVAADGVCGSVPLAATASATAPFVGADGSAEGGIQMVCFDASLIGSFERLLVSPLLWA